IPEGLQTNVLAFDAKNRMMFGTETGVVLGDGKLWKDAKGSGNLAAINYLATAGDVIWTGAWRGIYRLENGKETFFKTGDGVKCLLPAGDGLFAGLSYGGLFHIDGETTTLYKPDNSGLEEEDVSAIALGHDGVVWILGGDEVFLLENGVIR